MMIAGDIPNYLGYSWEGCTGLKSRLGMVHFEDVLGRKLYLPAILCRDSDVRIPDTVLLLHPKIDS
jgi:hypothetical protein